MKKGQVERDWCLFISKEENSHGGVGSHGDSSLGQSVYVGMCVCEDRLGLQTVGRRAGPRLPRTESPHISLSLSLSFIFNIFVTFILNTYCHRFPAKNN